MSQANLFERILTGNDVEQAIVATLGDYMPDYLGELERTNGYEPGQIELPRGIVTSSEFEKWPEDELPVILVVNTGLTGKPVRRQNGAYEAAWAVGVSAIVSDLEEVATRKLGHVYAAAIRAAIVQHRALQSSIHPTGFANWLRWSGEDYGDIPFQDTRSLFAANVIFEVGLESVTTEQAGPRQPSTEPGTDPGPWPPVSEVIIEPEPISLTGVLP